MAEEQEQEASKSVFVALLKKEEGDATVILLVENAPKYLPNGALKPKGWGLPGGGVDGDEGEKHTAAREVTEETGYILDQESVTLLDYEMRNNHMVLVVTGKITGGRIKTTAGDDTITAAWFPVNRLPSTVYNSHKKRIARALEIMKEKGIINY